MDIKNARKLAGPVVHHSFTAFLLFYLTLFLLENLFPGFVSNTFDINILLWILLILGVASPFLPPPPEEPRPTQPAKKLDYAVITGFSMFAFICIWYKLNALGTMGLFIAIGSAFIVLALSFLVMFFPEEEEKKVKKKYTKLWIHNNRILNIYVPRIIKSLKQILTYQFKVPFVAIFMAMFIIVSLLSLVGKTVMSPFDKAQGKPVQSTNGEVTPTPEAGLSAEDKKLVPIQIYDAGRGSEGVTSMKNFLEAQGFVVEKTGFLDNDYFGMAIQFSPEHSKYVDLIERLVSDPYPLVSKVPLPDSADSHPHIRIILK